MPKSLRSRKRKRQDPLLVARLLFVAVAAFLSVAKLLPSKNQSQTSNLLELFEGYGDAAAAVVDRDLSKPGQKQKQKETSQEQYEPRFLDHSRLEPGEGFSASWIQRKEDFMSMNMSGIHTQVDAAFRAYAGPERVHRMRMTLDWLDFSVEHMSKWWKMLGWGLHGNGVAHQQITKHFTEYIDGAQEYLYKKEDEPLFRNTIAVVAFQKYSHKSNPEMTHNLTLTCLAATVESLRRAGFGRTVVATLAQEEFDIIQEAFRYLHDRVEAGTVRPHTTERVTMIGHMEVGSALAEAEDAVTKFVTNNIPRATLVGLYKAFAAKNSLAANDLNAVNSPDTESWLGDVRHNSYWKYVYFTEQDQVLQARPMAWQGIKTELDKGNIILPHRLQPLPHEWDVPGMSNENNIVLEADELSEIVELDSHDDACCDEDAGRGVNPTKNEQFETPCKSHPWFTCGFGRGMKDVEKRHERLKLFNLIKLSRGTGIVNLAGSNHARRCIPRKGVGCGTNVSSVRDKAR